MATKTETQATGMTGEDAGSGGGARQAAEGVAANLAGAANTVSARLPEAAASTRAAVDEATRRMTTGSDQMLTVGTAFSLGLTIGLMVGGANRILVTLAMIPAAAMGMTLLDRNSDGRGRKPLA
jgi:hypothetical protein